ncbi:hypothetical protein B7R21_18275 [Subtercola boreus]|uniref:Uncharacterized protein n=1 Tax=Subtercola boreus TaxID=120213 RepID=A0A3E0VBC7_9MICO|nr:hypothetical protein [Subtercola boreus]RFA06798.1 hypothetical protein B7R21_18275 [Subtercola boreus]
MSDHDEVGQEVSQQARIALTIALQMGEKFARLREEMSRDAEARSGAQARELSARFNGERSAARASLQVVDRPEWWDKASVQDVARVTETAAAWQNHDPAAQHAAAVVNREVTERYGVDTTELETAVKPERVRAGRDLTKAQLLIAEADRLDRANEARTETTPAEGSEDVDNGRAMMAGEMEARANDYERDAEHGGTDAQTPHQLRELAADARAQAQLFRDTSAETEQTAGTTDSAAAPGGRSSATREAGEVAYDSAERRQETIQAMEAKGIPPHLIGARMSADSAHATPPSSTVTSKAQLSTVPQTHRGRKTGHGADRGDLSR